MPEKSFIESALPVHPLPVKIRRVDGSTINRSTTNAE
jgi:hypothetical protein